MCDYSIPFSKVDSPQLIYFDYLNQLKKLLTQNLSAKV
jgi:hypothetical protein